jgi:RanBP1 domain
MNKIVSPNFSSLYPYYSHFALSVMTGEEEEDTVHQVRGKLFSLADSTQWKERGTGTLKLNVRRSDGNGARLGIVCLLMKLE